MKKIKLDDMRGLATEMRVGERLANLDGVASRDLPHKEIYALNS